MSEKLGHDNEWSSSLGFIIACVGSAVGLGNLWKFPYITFENGGGAFVLIYFIAVLAVGFPLLLSEMIIGRHAKLNVYGAFKVLSKNKRLWKAVGLLSILTSSVILSYYCVVAGWTLDYFLNSLSGGLKTQNDTSVVSYFTSFVGSGGKQVLYHTLFMILTAGIVLKGTKGIEKAVKILMPLLFLFVVIIMSVSLYRYGGSETVSYMTNFDFSKLTPSSILEAVGHAFFTLSLGMGVMIIYGSYVPRNVSLVRSSFYIMFFDTLIAIMACFMMYPIIFGANLEISESSSILFTTLTVQFNALPMGSYISALFYLLVAFAALTSTISLLEPITSFVSEEFKMSRKVSTLLCSFLIWVLGVLSALSNGANEFLTKISFFDNVDYLASNWGLTIGGIFVSIFVGFKLSKKVHLEELSLSSSNLFYKTWLVGIRYFAPIVITFIILSKIGIF